VQETKFATIAPSKVDKTASPRIKPPWISVPWWRA